jgi:T4 bacteriophage base plate protein
MLPTIAQRTFTVTVPSTGKTCKFRPYVVKEEKLLLMAKESGNESSMIDALKDVIDACSMSGPVPYSSQSPALFDLEYLFLRLTAASVDDVAKIAYKDAEDDKIYEFTVDLNKVEVKFFPEHEEVRSFKVSDDVGVRMVPYPAATVVQEMEAETSLAGVTTAVIRSCIESIWDGTDVYPAVDADPQEMKDFIDNLPISAMRNIRKYFETVPRLSHTIEWTNTKGKKRTVELSRLQDFFTLR